MKGRFLLGFCTGAFIIMVAELAFHHRGPTTEDRLRAYAAYQECIPRPNCMTAADFIDYYNLKWRLESE